MLGALSTLLSSTFWQISAIYLSLPVSGSHSIVSGLIGKIRDMGLGRKYIFGSIMSSSCHNHCLSAIKVSQPSAFSLRSL